MIFVMLNRSGLIFVVALAAGCSSSTDPDTAPTGTTTQKAPNEAQPAGSGKSGELSHVTFYLPGMNQKLKIL